jgi:hypothetical protein
MLPIIVRYGGREFCGKVGECVIQYEGNQQIRSFSPSLSFSIAVQLTCSFLIDSPVNRSQYKFCEADMRGKVRHR